MFFKNIELHKKYKKHGVLRKMEQLKLLILVFNLINLSKGKFISSKKNLLILLFLKILLTITKILFNIIARLNDQYVVFIYTKTMLRNAQRKICRCFIRN